MIGEISALGCGLCWAMSSVITKSLVPKFQPLTLNLLRCLGAAAVLWGLIPFHPGVKELFQAQPISIIYLVASALVGISLGDTIYIRALKLIDVTLAFPIGQAAWPFFTLLAALFFLGEPMTPSLALGAALAIGGVYLVASPERIRPSFPVGPGNRSKGGGITLVLVASFFWSIAVALLKMGLEGMNLVLANGIRLPMAALVLVPLTLGQKGTSLPFRPGRREVFGAAFSGILSFGLGGILFLVAIQNAGAGKASVLTSCGPLFGLPLSVILLEERPTPKVCWGTGLVVAGIILLV